MLLTYSARLLLLFFFQTATFQLYKFHNREFCCEAHLSLGWGDDIDFVWTEKKKKETKKQTKKIYFELAEHWWGPLSNHSCTGSLLMLLEVWNWSKRVKAGKQRGTEGETDRWHADDSRVKGMNLLPAASIGRRGSAGDVVNKAAVGSAEVCQEVM